MSGPGWPSMPRPMTDTVLLSFAALIVNTAVGTSAIIGFWYSVLAMARPPSVRAYSSSSWTCSSLSSAVRSGGPTETLSSRGGTTAVVCWNTTRPSP